ncbi:DUF3223 domain-containing protein [Erythrobacter sp. SAORIC-644]|uniref:DCL family protein n=1 Tax=Erythrobacter sp. SAORIC-644 TaxID=1869314 RepID=UPI000C9F5701|nr:DCL family protein [Erythrobacter sp. SAORIC-644]PNQ73559.1 DUF3223 domain-containing protein [Erythrobacter sp. SAORIC-644]
MPAQPIDLATMHFAKKGDAAEYLREMLNRYDRGDKVSAADAKVLQAALERHPEADEKIGCGISHFSVRTSIYGKRCFWVNRTDGTTDDFSYKSCIYG